MKKTLLFAAIAALGIMPTNAPAHAFTDGEKAELHNIIKDYIDNNPEAIIESLNNAQRKKYEEERKKAQKDIKKYLPELQRDAADPVMGNPEGKITIVEFFDYNCGYCKRVFPSIMQLIKEDNDVRVVFKEKPSLGQTSFFASKAALAAKKQGKYFEMHKALMNSKGRISEAKVMKIAQDIGLDTDKLSKDLDSAEINEVIKKNAQLGGKIGVRGVPAIIIEEQYFPGAMPLEAMKEEIAKIRAARK